MNRGIRRVVGVLALATGLMFTAGTSPADETGAPAPPPTVAIAVAQAEGGQAPPAGEAPTAKETQQEQRAIIVQRITAAVPGKYWIGVQAEPLPEALRSHLKLDQGVLVLDVIADSPAAKAGVQPQDILLQLGEHPLESVESLLQAVEKTTAQATTAKLVRQGETRELQITPEERKELAAPTRIPLNREALEAWVAGPGDGPLRLRAVAPAVVLGTQPAAQPLPEDLVIKIQKAGNKPAQIVVTRKDQQWEVSADKLQDLPEEIRGYVGRVMPGDTICIDMNRPAAVNVWEFLPPQARSKAQAQAAEAHQKVAEAHQKAAAAAGKVRIEVQRKMEHPGAPTPPADGEVVQALKALEKSVEALRQQVEKLSPAAP